MENVLEENHAYTSVRKPQFFWGKGSLLADIQRQLSSLPVAADNITTLKRKIQSFWYLYGTEKQMNIAASCSVQK